MITKTFLAVCLLAPASGAWGQTEGLLKTADRLYRFERVGTLTSVRCAKVDKQSREDCRLLEEVDPEPQIDWDSVTAKAKARAAKSKGGDPDEIMVKQTVFDQYAAPWLLILSRGPDAGAPDDLKPFAVSLEASFQGYKVVREDGKVKSAEPLVKPEEWTQAAKELGIDPSGKRKKGLGGLFQ